MREYKDSSTVYPMPYLTNENMFLYSEAYDINQYKYLDLIAEASKHVCQGISTTLYATSENTTEDLVKYYYYAWKKNLKTLYYTRTRVTNINECESCSI